MCCYIIPTLTAIMHFFLRKKIPIWRENKHHTWLSMLLFGGSIFGIVDHLWNKELFLIGKNFIYDIFLGITITLVILGTWACLVFIDKSKDLTSNSKTFKYQ